MIKQLSLALAVCLGVVAFASPAAAGGQKDSIGAGAEFGLNGRTGGVSANYDAGKFHFGGFFGLLDGGGSDDTDFTIGARFFFHVHSTAMSDFGVGGGLGFYSHDRPDIMGGRQEFLYLEPSMQIRLFVAANVALSFTAGIVIRTVDDDGLSIGAPSALDLGGGFGLVTGTAGVHYYFF